MKPLTRFALLLTLIFLLLFAVVPVMAQEAEPTPAPTVVIDNDTGEAVPTAPGEPLDIIVFVTLVVANGVSLVPLLNKIPAWVNAPGSFKGIAVFVLLLLLPTAGDLVTTALLSLPKEVLTRVNYQFFLLQAGFWMWAGSQYGYEWYQTLRLKTGETK